MRLLGRFGILLLLLGLGLGWAARRRWGPLRGAWPWLAALVVAPLHGIVVLTRGASVGVETGPLLAFGLATAALLAGSAIAATRTMRARSAWAAAVPLAHALLQGVATSALGAPFSAAGAAPPGLGSALVAGLAVVVAGAWLVWVPAAREPGSRFGWLRRSGRLRS